MGKLQATNFPASVELVQMDVCQAASIEEAVDEVVSKAGRIGENEKKELSLDTPPPSS